MPITRLHDTISQNFRQKSSYHLSQVTYPNPSISQPPDLEYQEGETGNTITWLVMNASETTYEVWRRPNSTLIKKGSLSNQPTNITVSVDGLPIGMHTYILTVFRSYVHGAWWDWVDVIVSEKSSTDNTLMILALTAIVGFSVVVLLVLVHIRQKHEQASSSLLL
jgi:hypothetical protein